MKTALAKTTATPSGKLVWPARRIGTAIASESWLEKSPRKEVNNHMVYSQDEIVADILGHVHAFGDAHCLWYVGIGKNAESRLFEGHGVRAHTDPWIYREAASAVTARGTEASLLRLGFDGGTGGGDDTATDVYAYRKQSHTRQ